MCERENCILLTKHAVNFPADNVDKENKYHFCVLRFKPLGATIIAEKPQILHNGEPMVSYFIYASFSTSMFAC